MHEHRYRHLVVMTALSFIVMYILMYAMVDRIGNVYPNINQAYMAGLMAAPMVIIELLVMRSMYQERWKNVMFIAAALVALIACLIGIRAQIAVGDVQFAKSMIPHHSGAILMCDRASITDAELKKLCSEIVTGQQREIEQLKSVLARLATR